MPTPPRIPGMDDLHPLEEGDKDRPLLLRRGRDGQLSLDTRYADSFPPRHEFSKDWLLENSKQVSMDDDTIKLTFANGWAVYKIVREAMAETRVAEDEETANAYGVSVGDSYEAVLSTGYWGVLTDSEVTDG
jgi:hypothetical protein